MLVVTKEVQAQAWVVALVSLESAVPMEVLRSGTERSESSEEALGPEVLVVPEVVPLAEEVVLEVGLEVDTEA